MNDNVSILGIEIDHPQYKYSTTELIDMLGNKISEKVKENIKQLGVEQRFFTRPIEHYLLSSQTNSLDNNEPISDLSAQVAKNCLSNLDINLDKISCLIAASENNDYLSPGLSSIIIRKIGLPNFIPHFNLQGMACSSFPKVLELGSKLVKDESDNVLIVISGCNSGWYLPHLGDEISIRNPKEIGEKQYDRDKQIKKWVSTMFSFLFGDGVAALILSKTPRGQTSIKLGKMTHAVNFDTYDYRKACVKMDGQLSSHLYEYQLTAGSHVLDLALDYSKKVLMKSLGKNPESYDPDSACSYLSTMKKIMIHTGSLKILDGFKNLYGLKDEQIQESYDTLREFGNLTGVSIPMVLKKAMLGKDITNGIGLLIGITMGFGLDLVEIEKVS